MSKKRARPPKTPIVPAPRSQLIIASLVFCGAITLMSLIMLRWWKIPLGQQFNYRYSELAELKTAVGLWPIVVMLGPLALSAWCIARSKFRALGLSLGMLCILLLAVWTALAIPRPIRQHSVNLVSPSHDGAFVMEAHDIPSLPDYLRNFSQYIHRSVRSMGGTRILANPPGMTILAVWERRIFPVSHNWLTPVERYLIDKEGIDNDEATFMFAHGLRFGMILLLMWALSAPLAYLLGRQFMAPLGAALFALLVTFNPCTVHFSPGKDAAQLLTINAMLLAWFNGVRRDRSWATALAGALLLVGAICGLIHFWIAIAALGASLWQSWSEGRFKHEVLKHVVAATLGFLLLALVIYFACGWNSIGTLIATGRLYNKVKNTIGINETLWLFIGLPIFLLFVTPALWTTFFLTLRRWRVSGFGVRLFICTFISMALSYTLGVSWELPRVWIAYLPLLFLATMIDVPLFRSANARAVKPILVIVTVSMLFTAIHWTLLDVRESEYRAILTNRAWY